MSELAFNMNGEPFDVPPTATGWRVRRMKHKGAPEVVYGRDGIPLVLPIEADVDDLRREVGTAGRYRVDPSRASPGQGAAGYVFAHAASRACAASIFRPQRRIVIEAMRMNARRSLGSIASRRCSRLRRRSAAADGAFCRSPWMASSTMTLKTAPRPPSTGSTSNALGRSGGP